MNHSILCQMRMPLVLLLIAATFCLTGYAGTWVDLFNDPESKDWEVNWDGPRNHANAPGEVNIKIEVGTYILPLVLSFPIVVGSRKLASYLRMNGKTIQWR